MEPKPAITNYQPLKLISKILPKNQIEFSLTREQLPIITNQKEHSTEQEILLAKIRNLEENLVSVKQQLKQVQVENNHLKLENKHLKTLIRQNREIETKILQPLPFKIKN